MVSRRALIAIGATAALLAAGTIALYLIGVRATKDCTLVGCTSAVTFDLSTIDPDLRREATSVRFCANSKCVAGALVPGQPAAQVGLDERTVRSGSLTLTNAAGAVIVNVELDREYQAEESQPNGPDCEPTCWRLTLGRLDGVLKPALRI